MTRNKSKSDRRFTPTILALLALFALACGYAIHEVLNGRVQPGAAAFALLIMAVVSVGVAAVIATD